MRILLLPFLLSWTNWAFAQQDQAHWFFGQRLGLKFQGTTAQIIPVQRNLMYAPYASTAYSNPVTGNLVCYTNGQIIYNSIHQPVPIPGSIFGIEAIIVPHPGKRDQYYIFSTGTNQVLYYTIFDASLNGGYGAVLQDATPLNSHADAQFCVVKQEYNNGYWLIAHDYGGNFFSAYRISPEGIDLNPVKSITGNPSPGDATYSTGRMISNSKGTDIVFTSGSITSVARAERFAFDKRCGTLTFKDAFFAYPRALVEQRAYPAYSPNDEVLYINWQYNSGAILLLQYNLKDADPNATYFLAAEPLEGTGDMQLGPDGKIYMATAEESTVTSKVSIIQNPNQLGPGCNFQDKAIDLGIPGSPTATFYTEHFPSYILDRSVPGTGYQDPIPVIDGGCFPRPVSYRITNNLVADSFYWDFGDSQRSLTLSGSHAYAAAGTYVVSFNWFKCGKQHQRKQELRYRLPIPFDLGRDSTLCAGVPYTLTAPPAEEYKWSTGASTQTIVVTSPAQIKLSLRNGNCWSEDSVSINYYPPLWLALGDEYTICEDEKELVKLDAGEGFNRYKWTPTGDTTQWIIVGDVGAYFVVVNDFRGCKGEDGTNVKRRCPVQVFFPNAFTPNADGKNELYEPKGKDVVGFHLMIFNRWGQQIFESKSIDHKWDGKTEGKDAPADVYLYQCNYSGYRNKKLVNLESKGSFTLIR